ncbi:MAG TPA: CvpA family protein [Verrucomicrobiota bacterium]|mgnify:CR=1 FL=1|nr:CvpA family protein [Verrucomicrobiota bacterium]
MTIWILALVLLASLAGIGYRQGAIRVAFSLIAIPIAAFSAPALAKFVVPALKVLGVSHPLLQWLIAPVIVFIVILSIFKVAGFAVFRKVDVFFRYKAGDLQFALWERLNSRCGLCLALVNGLLYLILACWMIFTLGYWTVQTAPSTSDPKLIRLLNRMAWDLQKTGMNKVAAAVDRTLPIRYEMADVAGFVYQNTLIEARIARYPAFLSLGERQEFQSLAKDQSFMDLRLQRAPIRELMKNSQVDQMVRNPEILNLVWDTVAEDIEDLQAFLETGRSAKYDPILILGRWHFTTGSSVAAYRRERPNLPTSEVQKIRRGVYERFAETSLVASPDKKFVIKGFPNLKSVTLTENETLRGTWKGGDGDYVFTFESGDERVVRVEGNKLQMRAEQFPIVLEREE